MDTDFLDAVRVSSRYGSGLIATFAEAPVIEIPPVGGMGPGTGNPLG